jgi:hypothetical protein
VTPAEEPADDVTAFTPDQVATVMAFINDRPRYVAVLRDSTVADADYNRWSGHAEARRQLATSLGLTVPFEPGETTHA